MNLTIDPRLLSVAITELPTVIDLLKSAFRRAHPDQPAPTSEEVIAAYQSALRTSLATDDAYLAAHPDQA